MLWWNENFGNSKKKQARAPVKVNFFLCYHGDTVLRSLPYQYQHIDGVMTDFYDSRLQTVCMIISLLQTRAVFLAGMIRKMY
jgi:hypothetical protein